MPLFGGFKKTLRLKSLVKSNKETDNSGEPICGAYRINREEFFSTNDPMKRNTSPIVQMTYPQPMLKHSHSSDNILNKQANTRQSMPDIAQPEPAPRKSKNEKEMKRIQKQEAEKKKAELAEKKKIELAEQKKREKLALKEQQIKKLNKENVNSPKAEVKTQAKVQKEQVKEHEKLHRKEVKTQKRETKEHETTEKKEVKPDKKALKLKPKKNAAPQPNVTNIPPLPAQNIPNASNYSTNTLESSISRTSGPPPYTEEPNIAPNIGDTTGNTSFAAPSEEFSSWDLISEHRQQLNRPKATSGGARQTHMDLQYGRMDRRDNSEV